MTVKTILAAASGGTASNGAIELGCRLASRLGAHIEVFHVRTDIKEVMLSTAGDFMGVPPTGDWIDRIAEEDAEISARTHKDFVRAVQRHALTETKRYLPGPSASWHEETGTAAALLPLRARFFDLVMLGRSERVVDGAASDVVEQVLLYSGRPVLLAPAEPPDHIGERVAIGWDGSPQAVRAVAAALPCLEKARAVSIVTIGDESDKDPDILATYLACHAVDATVTRVTPVSGVHAGALLLSAARADRADLLVVGGYGHAPWREFLLGGATRDLVGTSLLPLLLTH